MTFYDQKFYDWQQLSARRSAQVVVPMLYDRFTPERVLDIGCGRGWWGDVFAKYGGCAVVGVDGDYVPDPVIPFVAADLTVSLPSEFHDSADLTLCLEVAEHLDIEHASRLVADLCATAPVVVFSAARPHQGGHGHVNEQWPEFWTERFADNEFRVSSYFRWLLWNDDRIAWWYRQNLLVAVAPSVDADWLFDGMLSFPFPVIHPASVDWDD